MLALTSPKLTFLFMLCVPLTVAPIRYAVAFTATLPCPPGRLAEGRFLIDETLHELLTVQAYDRLAASRVFFMIEGVTSLRPAPHQPARTSHRRVISWCSGGHRRDLWTGGHGARRAIVR